MYSPLTLLLVAATAAGALANMGPPKPAKTIGPSVLADCGCTAFTDVVNKCQSVSGDATSCICDKSWYGASTSCRDCLLLATGFKIGTSDPVEMFYDSYSQAITNIFVACTNKGASVKSLPLEDEPGICGWNSFGGWACVGLDQANSTAWASEYDNNNQLRLGRAPYSGLALASVSVAPKSSATPSPSALSSGASSADASVTGSKTSDASASGTASPAKVSGNSTASESAAPSDNPTGAAPELRKGLGSSLALVGVFALLIAAF